jgi:hypothetical protein
MSKFNVPSSFNPGVLPRQSNFGTLPQTPAYRDSPYPVLSDDDIRDIVRSQNKPTGRELVWSVFDQGSVGSCASESKDGAVKIVRAGEGREPVEFNPYATYGRVNGGYDQGSSLDDNVTFAAEHGCFPESAWPRSKGWRAMPSEEAYEEAYKYRLSESYDIDTSRRAFYGEFFSALVSVDKPAIHFGYPGHAIVAVSLVEEAGASPEAIECANRIDQYLLEKELLPCLSSVGGIADEMLIEFLNSWDLIWGDMGFGYLRASRIERAYGAYLLLSTTTS